MGIAMNNKVVLVTGASRGTGKGIAQQFGEAGATVYITGRRPEESENSKWGLPNLEEIAQNICKSGGIGIAVYVNHCNDSEVEYLFEKIKNEQNGRLDIVVNNVNCLHQSIKMQKKPFYEIDISAWSNSLHSMIRNYYICTINSTKMMLQNQKGVIINISQCFLDNLLATLTSDLSKDVMKHNITIISLKICEVPQVEYKSIYIGKSLTRFSIDPNNFHSSGKILTSDYLIHKYGILEKENQFNRSIKTLLPFISK